MIEVLLQALIELVFYVIGYILEYFTIKIAAKNLRLFMMWFVGLVMIAVFFAVRGTEVWSPYIFTMVMTGFLCSATFMVLKSKD